MTSPFQPSPEDIEWRDALRGLPQRKLDDRLCEAVDAESLWRVKEALAAGANARAAGDQPLRRAAVSGLFGIARALLDAGANVHVNDEEPLCWAARGGHVALVELFLSRGADEKSWGGRRAKTWAQDYKQANAVFLLEQGADIRANRKRNGSSYAETIADRIAKRAGLPIEQIKKGEVKSDVYLHLLGEAGQLDRLFAPDQWVGNTAEMAKLWGRIPKKFQPQVDLHGKISAVGAHVLKSNKPPKIKFR